MEDKNVRIVDSYDEVIKLYPLMHKFFEKAKPDYTEEEFFQNLPWILDNGVIGYVLEDEKPIAYGVIIFVRIFHDVALILQVYAPRPGLIQKMIELSEQVTREAGLENQVALVEFDKVKFFEKKYGMKATHVLMEREMNPEPEVDMSRIVFEPEKEEVM